MVTNKEIRAYEEFSNTKLLTTVPANAIISKLPALVSITLHTVA